MEASAGSSLVFIVTNFPAKVQGDTVRTVFLDFSLQRLTNLTNFPAKVQGDTVRTVFLDFSLQRLTNLSFYFGDNNNYPATSQKK